MKSCKILTLLLASTLLFTSCDNNTDKKESETTSSTTVVTTETTEEVTTAPEEEIETEVTTTAETEATTTTTTAPPLPPALSGSYIGEEYVDTFYLRPESKSKVSDITLSVVSSTNVSIKATTVVDDKVFAQAEIATAENGARVYNTYMMHFPIKFVITADEKVYIVNDAGNFYFDVTDNPYYDISKLEAANVNYNYTLIGDTADHVSLNDVIYTRMQATDNNNGLYEILYFDEEGVLKFIYTEEAVYGEALTTLEYTEVDDSYFGIPSSYAAYDEEAYLNYMNKIMSDLGYNQITTTAAPVAPIETLESDGDTTSPVEE